MFDEFIKTDSSLAFKPKNLSLPPKIKSSNLKRKAIPT
jgi:hypothetical protein